MMIYPGDLHETWCDLVSVSITGFIYVSVTMLVCSVVQRAENELPLKYT